jgi:hypothetical protein
MSHHPIVIHHPGDYYYRRRPRHIMVPWRGRYRRYYRGPRYGGYEVNVQSDAPLAATSYRIGGSGEWTHAADVIPNTDVRVLIPESEFPEASPGAVIPIEFKAFDGQSESPIEIMNGVVNHPPELTVNEQAEPVVQEDGRKIEMPFQVNDADGDAVRLFYKFDNAAEWTELPASNPPNVLPGSVFADLDRNVGHELQVLAFDGCDESEPRPLFLGGLFAKVLPTLINAGKNLLGLSVVPASKLAGEAVHAGLSSLSGGSLSVSHNIDDSPTWSDPVSYPLGQYQVFKFGDQSEPYLQPGAHSIKFRFQEESGQVTEQSVQYTINSPPTLELTNTEPLSFNSASTNGVPVPISVSDGDNDPITVFYRFQDDERWSHLPTANGEYVLPANAFSDRLNDGSGVVELYAWDGVEQNGNALKIPYSITGNGVRPEANEEPIAEDSGLFGALSPAAFVGIIVGGVAVIAVAIGIIVYARRKKQESGTPNLIENE